MLGSSLGTLQAKLNAEPGFSVCYIWSQTLRKSADFTLRETPFENRGYYCVYVEGIHVFDNVTAQWNCWWSNNLCVIWTAVKIAALLSLLWALLDPSSFYFFIFKRSGHYIHRALLDFRGFYMFLPNVTACESRGFASWLVSISN